MGESQKHYAKWKIPDSKDATYCVIPFIRHSETGKTIGKKLWLPGAGWSEEGLTTRGMIVVRITQLPALVKIHVTVHQKMSIFLHAKKLNKRILFCDQFEYKPTHQTLFQLDYSSNSFYIRILTQALYEESLASERS